jgi:hypothetical protein
MGRRRRPPSRSHSTRSAILSAPGSQGASQSSSRLNWPSWPKTWPIGGTQSKFGGIARPGCCRRWSAILLPCPRNRSPFLDMVALMELQSGPNLYRPPNVMWTQKIKIRRNVSFDAIPASSAITASLGASLPMKAIIYNCSEDRGPAARMLLAMSTIPLASVILTKCLSGSSDATLRQQCCRSVLHASGSGTNTLSNLADISEKDLVNDKCEPKTERRYSKCGQCDHSPLKFGYSPLQVF